MSENEFVSQEEMRRRLNDIGHAVDERLPQHWAFFIMVFPTAEANHPEPSANYISNAKREDVVRVIKEWIIRGGHAENWMKNFLEEPPK